jgi:hypothetical protein
MRQAAHQCVTDTEGDQACQASQAGQGHELGWQMQGIGATELCLLH